MVLQEAFSLLRRPQMGATHQRIIDAFPDLPWNQPADRPRATIDEDMRTNVEAVRTAALTTSTSRWNGSNTDWLDPAYARVLKDPQLPEDIFQPALSPSTTGAGGGARAAERAAFLVASATLNMAQDRAGGLTAKAAQAARTAAQAGATSLGSWYAEVDNSSTVISPNGLVTQFQTRVEESMPNRIGNPVAVFVRKAAIKWHTRRDNRRQQNGKKG